MAMDRIKLCYHHSSYLASQHVLEIQVVEAGTDN